MGAAAPKRGRAIYINDEGDRMKEKIKKYSLPVLALALSTVSALF